VRKSASTTARVARKMQRRRQKGPLCIVPHSQMLFAVVGACLVIRNTPLLRLR
jgi:hypothetical protein